MLIPVIVGDLFGARDIQGPVSVYLASQAVAGFAGYPFLG